MCGEVVTEKIKIDKTLSTFHPNNINLAEMYRERKFTKFGDLLSTLLVAEQNHELVIKNHQSRPTGSMHEDLKSEYLEVEDPFVLWENLKDRFDHQKLVYLPAAKNDWANLRLQDFKSVRAYSYALFKIKSRLIMCGEEVTKRKKKTKHYPFFFQ